MKILSALLLCSLSAGAQTWFQVATEDTRDPVTLPAGTIYRYGVSTGKTSNGADCAKAACWVTATAAKDVTFDSLFFPNGKMGATDPAPGIGKGLFVQETAVPQTVTVGANKVTVPPLPALPVGSWSLAGCVLDIYSDNTAKIRSGCVVTKQ